MTIEGLKRSARTIRETWGTSLRTTLRFGFLGFALTFLPLVAVMVGFFRIADGAGASDTGTIAIGAVIAGIGFFALIVIASALSAVNTYAYAVIYRWTTGRPVPGIDPALFAGAFTARRGRRR